MDHRIRAVAITGNIRRPSRTARLAEEILSAVSTHLDIEAHLLELAEVGPKVGRATTREELCADGRRAIELAESAHLLVVCTPVYRGSYAGLLKHFFDLVEQDAFSEIPVVLAATGGSDRHASVIDHQLRPLFSVFGAHTMPTGIYATERDFADGAVVSPGVLSRIERAARQAVKFFLMKSASAAAATSAALSAPDNV